MSFEDILERLNKLKTKLIKERVLEEFATEADLKDLDEKVLIKLLAKKFVFRLSKKINLKPTTKTYDIIKSLYDYRRDFSYVKKNIRKSILNKLLKSD